MAFKRSSVRFRLAPPSLLLAWRVAETGHPTGGLFIPAPCHRSAANEPGTLRPRFRHVQFHRRGRGRGGRAAPAAARRRAGRPFRSAIFFSFEDDRTWFGRRAVEEYVTGADGRLMRSIEERAGHPAVRRHHPGQAPVARRFPRSSGTFIGELKRRAGGRRSAGRSTTSSVGRPVHFVDDDDAADARGAAAARRRRSGRRASGTSNSSSSRSRRRSTTSSR